MNEKYTQLYHLKQKATDHMNQKKYSWAMVYLCDVLKQFESIIEHIDNADEMQKLIRQVKLPSHKNLSLCYLKQGNYTGCIQQCKQVLQAEPNSVKILYRIGSAHMNMNNLEQAQKYLKKAFLLDPNEKQVMKSLQRIEYLRNIKQKSESNLKAKQNNITLGLLIKIIFFWPFLIMLWVYRKIVPEKNKTL